LTADDDAGAAGTQENQMFYAHYYLGAYFEALRDDAKARPPALHAIPLTRTHRQTDRQCAMHWSDTHRDLA
jgi:hypothetical protein